MWYDNYEKLEIHFSRSHFMCPYDSCRSKCYVAFQTESELQAHLNIAHTQRAVDQSKVNANALLGFQSDEPQDQEPQERQRFKHQK